MGRGFQSRLVHIGGIVRHLFQQIIRVNWLCFHLQLAQLFGCRLCVIVVEIVL